MKYDKEKIDVSSKGPFPNEGPLLEKLFFVIVSGSKCIQKVQVLLLRDYIFNALRTVH